MERTTLKEYALQAYAQELVICIREVAESKCFGCSMDHPSQVQHDVCIMMPWEERIEECFDEALDLLRNKRINDVLTRYYRRIDAERCESNRLLVLEVIEDELTAKEAFTYRWVEDMKMRLRRSFEF